MIQDMDSGKRNLIVYDMVTGTKYLLRAAKSTSRDLWLNKSNALSLKAKKEISEELATSRTRSASEPMEFARSFSFFRREREGSKRKSKRPTSSTGLRRPSQSNEEVVGISRVSNLSVCKS